MPAKITTAGKGYEARTEYGLRLVTPPATTTPHEGAAGEFERFEDLTRKLAQTPKPDDD